MCIYIYTYIYMYIETSERDRVGGGGRRTPKVFWAVRAAIAVMANAPFASDALISA